MKYIEVKICTSKQGIEYITAFLMARGISETSIKGGEDIKELIKNVDENDSECISSDLSEKEDELLKAIRLVSSGKTFISPSIAGKVMEGYLEGKKHLKERSSWDTLTQREKEVLKL